MAAFEYPAITGLDLVAKAGLFVAASLDPSRLPMNRVDVNDRQARAFTKLACQGALPGTRLANDHHSLQ